MAVKINLKDIAGFLIIVFCGFYINIFPISPVYITSLLSCFFLMIVIVGQRRKIKIRPYIYLAFLYAMYIVCVHFSVEKDSAFYNTIFSIAYFILAYLSANILSEEKLIKYSKYLLKGSIFLLLIECLFRIINPVMNNDYVGNLFFYKYKFNSIMYQDSNFVGVYIIALLFFCVYMENIKNIGLKKEKIMLVILCFFTFSRAAILVAVFFLFFFNDKIKKCVKIGVVLTTVFLASGLLGYITSDASFLSKFDIINKAFDFWVNKATIRQLLFGVGYGQSFYYIGIASHNYLLTQLFESGFIGFLLFVLLWLSIFFESRKKAYFVMLPFLVVGFSMASHFIPYLYCIYVLIISFEKAK